jgi:hypothetical protein
MKKALLITLLLGATLGTAAQQKFKIIYGSLENSFTRKAVIGAKAELLLPDSTVIDSMRIREDLDVDQTPSAWFLRTRGSGKYILRFSHESYDTQYVNVNLHFHRREVAIDHGAVLLRRPSREVKLGEVVVRATRIKFFQHGDTMVYNADAFQMPEGSMLDALIRQLPGAELKDDGRIFVNGKFVESLTLNGRDFFKGNNQVMLDNLPSYMVQNVKVYEKASDADLFLHRTTANKKLTMDVNLKRQYAIGWIGNVEAGAGTSDRYLARLFAMRFTPQSRLTAYGTVNNLNDTRKPGQEGSWTPADLTGGLMASKIGGIDYSVNDKRHRFDIEGNAQLKHTNSDTRYHSTRVNFLTGGDTYERAFYGDKNTNTEFDTWHGFALKQHRFQFSFNPHFNYRKYHSSEQNLSGTFASDPAERFGASLADSLASPQAGTLLRSLALNRSLWAMKQNGHQLSADFAAEGILRMSHSSDGITFDATGRYDDQQEDRFRHYRLDYPQTQAAGTYRNEYHNLHPARGYNFYEGITYLFTLPNNMEFDYSYAYKQDYSRGLRQLYRLDRLQGWGADQSQALGLLPVGTDSLQTGRDIANSFHSYDHKYTHVANVAMGWQITNMSNLDQWYFKVALPVTCQTDRLSYLRGSLDTCLTRHDAFLDPNIYVVRKTHNMQHIFQFQYREETSTRNLANILPVRDDMDPLNVTLGATRLKNTHTHCVLATYRNNSTRLQRYFNLYADYNIVQNKQVTGYTYDRLTGVRTYTPDNVNGNYWSTLSADYTCPLDHLKHLTLTLKNYTKYTADVNLIQTSGAATATRSLVHTLYQYEYAKLSYDFGKLKLTAKGSCTWNRATSHRTDFSTVSAHTFDYGLTAQLDLPWNMHLSTDLTQYSRRGYNDHSMNTNDLVWNARLSKTFFHGQMQLLLDGFDMLGQLSSTSHSLDGQGRTETFYNVIPRYAMLHFVYHLNVKPKKNHSQGA